MTKCQIENLNIILCRLSVCVCMNGGRERKREEIRIIFIDPVTWNPLITTHTNTFESTRIERNSGKQKW